MTSLEMKRCLDLCLSMSFFLESVAAAEGLTEMRDAAHRVHEDAMAAKALSLENEENDEDEDEEEDEDEDDEEDDEHEDDEEYDKEEETAQEGDVVTAQEQGCSQPPFNHV